jgi:hypothetical protein
MNVEHVHNSNNSRLGSFLLKSSHLPVKVHTIKWFISMCILLTPFELFVCGRGLPVSHAQNGEPRQAS